MPELQPRDMFEPSSPANKSFDNGEPFAIFPQPEQMAHFKPMTNQELYLKIVAGAACSAVDVDPEIFFSERHQDVASAKRICRGCPVISSCQVYAIKTKQGFGIWGGMTLVELRSSRQNPIS